jgi:hypothetical protein
MKNIGRPDFWINTSMRSLNLTLAVLTAWALALQTTGAYAADVPDPQPSVTEVLVDIDDALADHPAARVDGVLSAELPDSGSQPAAATTATGTLTMDVPATGTDLTRASDDVAVFDGTAPDTVVAVRDTAQGLRALVRIDSPDAPERFDFPIGGDVVDLRLTPDGGVAALGAGGEVIATAPAPWATDANGVAVPTHFEIAGTTLTQVVEHHAGHFAYGIVADPWWNPFSWDWGKIVRTTVSAIGSALTKCGAGALKLVLEVAIGTGTTNFLMEKVGSTAARAWFGGVYGYIGFAVAGCIMAILY